jgi:hypothetical protein
LLNSTFGVISDPSGRAKGMVASADSVGALGVVPLVHVVMGGRLPVVPPPM